MEKRVYDEAFKQMAVELSYAKGAVKEVADELGIDPSRLSKWRNRESRPVEPIAELTEDQKEIKRLQKELKEAQLERDILKKGGEHLLQARRAVYGFIKEHRYQYPVEKMCRVLMVSISGFYYWLNYPVGLRERKEQQLVEQIKQIHEQSKCRYGSPRISFELREQGIMVSRPRVARLMQKYRVQSIVRRKYWVQTTDSNHLFTVADNYLNRDFAAE